MYDGTNVADKFEFTKYKFDGLTGNSDVNDIDNLV
jgi:hypothetical protein